MKEFGIITSFIYRLFYLLKFLPPQVLLESKGASDGDKQFEFKQRAMKAEWIIFGYLIVYIAAIVFNHSIYEHNALRWFTIIVILLRLIDIIQVNVNVTLFDPIREGQRTVTNINLHTIVRAVIIVAYAFIEVAVIFGLLYSFLKQGKLISDVPLVLGDYFYFSFITQLTIGYGEITPVGLAKLLTCFQGLTGYFFSILILSRLLSSLPGIGSHNK